LIELYKTPLWNFSCEIASERKSMLPTAASALARRSRSLALQPGTGAAPPSPALQLLIPTQLLLQQQQQQQQQQYRSFSSRGGGGGGGFFSSSFIGPWQWPIRATNTILNVVPQGHKFVVERFGKLHSIQDSGLFLAIPVVDTISYVVDVRERTWQ
jgi:hypothetical protein